MKPLIGVIPKGLVYLSLPYSSPDPTIRSRRMTDFWRMSASLINLGVHVISPMSMEPTLQHSNRGDDWVTWQAYCNSLLAAAEEVWVLELEGWDRSAGVAAEIEYANLHGKPVRFLEFNCA